MSRFEDSNDLFGVSPGDSTSSELICELCRKVYNQGIGTDEDNDDDWDEGESVLYTDFAGLQVCECCFGKIENEIVRRMSDILPWYKRIVDARKKQTESDEALLNQLSDEVQL